MFTFPSIRLVLFRGMAIVALAFSIGCSKKGFEINPSSISTTFYQTEIEPVSIIKKQEHFFYYMTLHVENKAASDMTFKLNDIMLDASTDKYAGLYIDAPYSVSPLTIYTIKANSHLKLDLYIASSQDDESFKFFGINQRGDQTPLIAK